MEIKMCKNKKCKRPLPESYVHKHCENCRNEHIKLIKDIGKSTLGVLVLVGGTAIAVLTNGKVNLKK